MGDVDDFFDFGDTPKKPEEKPDAELEELLKPLLHRKPEAVKTVKEPATEPATEAAKEAATESPREAEDRNTGNPIAMAKLGTPYPATDSANGERLAYWFGDRIRWDVARDCWRIWDGRRWAADANLKVLDMALQSARKIKREAAECPTKQGVKGVADTLWAWAAQSESEARLKACIERAKTVPGIAVGAGEWDCDPWLLNVKNGTIDLRTGKLKKHDKADKITKLADVDFEPEKTDEKWEKFLSDSTGGDKAFMAFLARAVGYTLTGMTTEERCFFVYGVAASGKTTFLETLKAAMGEYAATINPDMLCKSKFGGGGGGAGMG